MSKEEDIVEGAVHTATTGLVPQPVHGTFSPFRYPVFRAIWIANLFSNVGATLQGVGAAWLMTELTPSHQLVALVQASARCRSCCSASSRAPLPTTTTGDW